MHDAVQDLREACQNLIDIIDQGSGSTGIGMACSELLKSMDRISIDWHEEDKFKLYIIIRKEYIDHLRKNLINDFDRTFHGKIRLLTLEQISKSTEINFKQLLK